ncbi:hypothetical protein BDW60DRAFT_207783 [Aspergillus nidulans var. acristatus]
MSSFLVEALNCMGMHLVDIPTPILLKQMKAFWLSIPFYNAALLCAKGIDPNAILSRLSVQMHAPHLLDHDRDPCHALWFSNASIHIATDLAILVIPIPALYSFELPRKRRVALVAIFAVGGFVCITSICRLISLKHIAGSSDPFCDNVGAATWSAVEYNVGIICACLPTLRPLLPV